MPLNMNEIFQKMEELDASDLHIKVGVSPMFRVQGKLINTDFLPVKKEEVASIADKIIPAKLKETLTKEGSIDFAFSINTTTRFRTNAFYQKGSLSIAFRRLVGKNLQFENLHLPKVLYEIAEYSRGMILITGPTGTGKTTTMAALIDYINKTRKEHIITIEDPIEYIHVDKMSLVEQREIGLDAPSFDVCLKHAVRQDPDIVVVGEMRDKETINMAIRAAQTGHLIISTLHTINAVQTINRILKYFAAEEIEGIREDLAGTLRAVVSQRLLPSIDGKTRVPAVEVMRSDLTVAKLIRENRILDMEQIIKNGEMGMQTFDMSMAEHVRNKLIDFQTALRYADDQAAFKRFCEGIVAGTDRKGLIGSF